MIKKILMFIPNLISDRIRKRRDSFVTRLIKEDTNVSMMNFFLLCTLGVGVLLLIWPLIGMGFDIWYNHTITINLSDMAAYIVAVAGIFAAGGLSSAWTEFAYSKYDVHAITEEDMARNREARDAIDNAGDDEDLQRPEPGPDIEEVDVHKKFYRDTNKR